MLFSLVSVLALAASVHAHGYIDQIVADGKTYRGNAPWVKAKASPIRQISTTDPYKDPKGPGQTCGRNAKAGAVVAPITAGSTLSLKWVDHPGTAWQHEMGPMITYLAKVPAGKTAANVDPSTLSFFKIKQDGQTSPGSNKWVVAGQMKLSASYNVQVPKNIPSGDYIMRHEIIALHLADKKGGAEFYANCLQLKVSGGTGTTSPGPTAKFPGAYSATDKGIFTPNVFNRGFNYVFPGPALFTSAKREVDAPEELVERDAMPEDASEPAPEDELVERDVMPEDASEPAPEESELQPAPAKLHKRQWASRRHVVAAVAQLS